MFVHAKCATPPRRLLHDGRVPLHLVAAPDKYGGTATAAEIAAAMVRAAAAAGWTAEAVPMADGGEGTLEALGHLGTERRTTVHGPLGEPVDAAWRLLEWPDATRLGAAGRTAVIEAAQAAGRPLLPRPTGDDPLRATTAGVGELVLAAVGAGADEVVVAVGGTATTDGGAGAVQVLGDRGALGGARLTVACDVDIPFVEAAPTFAPQKGATPAQVAALTERLVALARDYRATFGVDVGALAGAGAGGGLAGGLAALGGRLVPGFELVAQANSLGARLSGADVVATGEGRLDSTSATGKVVSGVVRAAGARPVVCLPGTVAAGFGPVAGFGHDLVVLPLDEAVGDARAWTDPARAVEHVLTRWLREWPHGLRPA